MYKFKTTVFLKATLVIFGLTIVTLWFTALVDEGICEFFLCHIPEWAFYILGFPSYLLLDYFAGSRLSLIALLVLNTLSWALIYERLHSLVSAYRSGAKYPGQ
jgi:hypothetical protein